MNGLKQVEVPEIAPRQLVLWTLGVTAVAGAFFLLVRFKEIVPIILAAFVLSTAVRPAVRQLEDRGITRTAGILIIFGLIGALLALLIWQSIPVLGEQGAAISQNIFDGYRLLRERMAEMPNIVIQRLLDAMPEDLAGLALDPGSSAVTETDLPTSETEPQGRRFLNGIFQLIAVIMLTFYWTLDGEFIKQSLFLLIPFNKREDVRQTFQAMEKKISSYLWGQGVLCLVVGGLAFVAYLLIGLPNALLLAIFAGLLEAVPIIGPFLGAVPALIVGLSISPATALWVLLATGVIQQLENSFLVPKIMKQAIGVRPLVTLLALLAFGSLFGVLGALIALPLAAALQLLLDRYLLSQESLALTQVGRDQLSLLRYETNQLVQDVRSQVRVKDCVPSAISDALEDELEAIALDLESYLAAQGEKG